MQSSKQGTLLVWEYKDRFVDLVEYFPGLFDKIKQIYIIMGY
jgi:hypothetical protein